MFFLTWATLLFSVGGSYGDTGVSMVGTKPYCQNQHCITLTEGEITAEAGLCVIIPCSFTVRFSFIPRNIIWYKCEPLKQKCADSDIIFHTNMISEKVQSAFRGRVSLLDSDLNHNNCSIIINDLNESDSGSYQLRFTGSIFRDPDRFIFYPSATVSVKGLSQKPTVMIPPLTEGNQTTLSCTAPGLCSGSVPEITWTWRGAGVNDSHITGNITDFKTESLTAVTQRHSSTLTFDPSAEHHGTEVTCKVRFTGDRTTEETVTLNVSYVKEVKIRGNTNVQEGETLHLICSVESHPPPIIKWTKACFNKKLKNKAKSDLQSEPGTATLVISDVTAVDAGQYICTVKHLKETLTETVHVTVSAINLVHHHGLSAVLPWVIAGLSLSVNIFCLIYILYLWNTRQKVKPNHKDRTYMSLKKTDRSPEYDIIAQPLK